MTYPIGAGNGESNRRGRLPITPTADLDVVE
jgi:hypothetical protein